MERIAAIGFDLFNTLITIEASALEDALDRLTASLQADGLTFDAARFRELHRETAVRHVLRAKEDGKETHNRFWIGETLQGLGFEVQPDDPRVARAVEAYFSAFLERAELIPQTLETLQRLRSRRRLGLLSNFTHAPAARAILDTLGLTECFDALLISGDIGYRKPHPKPFAALTSSLGAAPGETLYVGDDPTADVQGAMDSGLVPVWSTYVRDRNIPQAPGLAALQRQEAAPREDCRRISDWSELLSLLHGS